MKAYRGTKPVSNNLLKKKKLNFFWKTSLRWVFSCQNAPEGTLVILDALVEVHLQKMLPCTLFFNHYFKPFNGFFGVGQELLGKVRVRGGWRHAYTV